MEDWDSYIRMLEEYNKPYERIIYEPMPLNIMTRSSRNAAAQPAASTPLPTKFKVTPTSSSVQKIPLVHTITPPSAVNVVQPTLLEATMLPPVSLPPPPPKSLTPPPKDPTPPPRLSTPAECPPPSAPTPPRLPTPVTPPVESPPCSYALPSTSRVSTPPREPSPPRVHVPIKSPTPPIINTPIFVEVETEVEVVPEEHELILERSEPEDISRFFVLLFFYLSLVE
ncbi:hypothetical protein ANCCEY_12397 [Ancylostoma ceylanicum]|uniref:Uncharacterized protein n=2 Tax=Ancylostoma ceylanicum TaxID=53326 RepID=A0A0D6LF18_9BILA|nr:hypothetical protein ANCCEY_12397 [Ancylostoma ceylanicum]